MAFPDDLLSADERVVLHLRPHAGKALTSPVLAAVLAVAAVVGAWLVLPDTSAGRFGLLACLAAAAVLVLTKAVPPWLAWRCTHYVITDERVLVQTGVVGRDRRDLPLAGVNDHLLRQSLLDRLLGCGRLTIDPLGECGPLVLGDVPQVLRVQTTLYELIEADRARGAEKVGVEGAGSGEPVPPARPGD